MPTLPSTTTLAVSSPPLSPEVLREVVRVAGGITKSHLALRQLGKQAMQAVHTMDRLRDIVRKTTSFSRTMQDFNMTPHLPLSIFTPQPSIMSHEWGPYTGSDPDVSAILQQRTNTLVKLPKGAQWSNVACHFTNKSTLSVSYQGNFIGRYDYAELGFGRKNMSIQQPDVQWELLYKLATLLSYEDGKLAPPTVTTLAGMLNVSEVTLFQRMRRLSMKLQDAFGINETPLLDYLPTTGYRTQFHLRSETFLRGQGQLRPSGSQAFERHMLSDTEEK